MTPRPCPACGADRPRDIGSISARDIVSGNSTYRPDALARLDQAPERGYPIVECRSCSFVYAHLLPSGEFLRVLYDEVIHPERAREESGSPAWIAHQLRLVSMLLERLASADLVRLLDYGCGYGAVVRALRDTPGIEVRGYEPSQAPFTWAKAEGLRVYNSLEEVEGGAPYDGVVLSDVLEHVAQPREFLVSIRRLVAAGGWICANVPSFDKERCNAIERAMRLGDPVSRELNPWEHLNYFSPKSLAHMVSAAGFRVEPWASGLDFGLRPNAHGVRRLGNVVKSVVRMIDFGLRQHPRTTTILARAA